jgi:hypothetical protein
MAKSLKERLIEQAEKLEKTRRLKEALARVEESLRFASEAGKVNRGIKSQLPPK